MATRAEVTSALDELTARMHEPWSREQEAFRNRTAERIVELPPADDAFVVQRFEHALALIQDDKDAWVVCYPLVRAFDEREFHGADPLLRTTAWDTRIVAWLRREAVTVLARWNPEGNAATLRALARRGDERVRDRAAECMAEAGVATRVDLDAFLRDPSYQVRQMTLRGLTEHAMRRKRTTADALLRLWVAARRDEHEKVREVATWMLAHLHHVPSVGGTA